ncbi:RING-finger-containing E3 ubiquitin ligase [Infectious spleen and kidney necrosis virus]|nr:RING-finger-containing E3 ubiquitin ligase [Infectious spleen and kidney necrosis virus]
MPHHGHEHSVVVLCGCHERCGDTVVYIGTVALLEHFQGHASVIAYGPQEPVCISGHSKTEIGCHFFGARYLILSQQTHVHASIDTRNMEKCIICFETIAKYAIVDCCNHTACVSCLTTWISQRPSCPLCQQPINTMAASDRHITEPVTKACLLRTKPMPLWAMVPQCDAGRIRSARRRLTFD